MCLILDITETELFKSIHPTNDKIIGYKAVLLAADGTLRSPFYPTFSWSVGEIISSRSQRDLMNHELTWLDVHTGIHICLTKDEIARVIAQMTDEGDGDYADATLAVLEVEVNTDDVVAVGRWNYSDRFQEQAVAMKVNVTKEAYEKALLEAQLNEEERKKTKNVPNS